MVSRAAAQAHAGARRRLATRMKWLRPWARGGVGIVGTMASELPSHRGRPRRWAQGPAALSGRGSAGQVSWLKGHPRSTPSHGPAGAGARSGCMSISSPFTVAGAASALHRLPSFASWALGPGRPCARVCLSENCALVARKRALVNDARADLPGSSRAHVVGRRNVLAGPWGPTLVAFLVRIGPRSDPQRVAIPTKQK